MATLLGWESLDAPIRCRTLCARRPMPLRASAGETVLDRPAVEPLERIVEALGRPAPPEVVAHQPLHALGVIEPSHLARHQHHPRGAGDARALVERERRRRGRRRRRASALPSVTASSSAMQAPCARYCSSGWAASPSRVDPAVAPALDRRPVGGGPALPALRQVQQRRARVADAAEVRQHLVLAALAHAPGLGARGCGR